MASERLRCLLAIVFTAIITFVITLAGVYAAIVVVNRQDRRRLNSPHPG